MAYVNVAEWKPDQVTEWLKGLDSSIAPYLQLFLNNEVNGQQLLNVRSEDLDNLGIKRLGHQELILEAVEHLRNFHYELDRENLQLLALKLSCQAHSLHNELLQHSDLQPVNTQTLADVASVVRAVKPLVCWLDRSPFSGQLEYADRKTDLLKFSLEIATCAQRDRFAERPVEEIRTSCGKLAAIADGIIQDIADPLILQPASLDLATLRKRGGDDLGFFILPSFHGVHQIGEIKFGSPAHQCGKVEEGDEVVQVNYQTVVGWQRKKVVALFEESLTDVFLTLKKRPRHTKVYGQIYMKPYRLPSKKRAPAYTRWHDNLPSPRPELLTIPDFELPVPRTLPKTPPSKHITLEPLSNTITSTSSESDDIGSGCDEASIDYELEGHTSPTSMRLYLPKPRVPVQRRATITGASPTSHLQPVDLEKFWRELKLEKRWKFYGKTPESHNSNPECRVLRNKSPCEQNERPSTCLGFEKSTSKEYIKQVDYVVKSDCDSKKIGSSLVKQEIPSDTLCVPQDREVSGSSNSISEAEKVIPITNASSNTAGKRYITRLELIVDPKDSHIEFSEVRDRNNEFPRQVIDNQKSDHAINACSDKDCSESIEKNRKISTESQLTEMPSIRERGRLDKSFSTPAYDLSGLDGLDVKQHCPSPKIQSEVADVSPTIKIPLDNDPPIENVAMPDVTASNIPGTRRAQDFSMFAVFRFPPAQTFALDQVRDYGSDHSDVNANPVLHGRVVETINRHLLDSNCGKGDGEDCTGVLEDPGMNSSPGISRTMANIVLNSPDLISDISTHRLYPKPNPDFDNGNSFHLQLSPRLDNSSVSYDSNFNNSLSKAPSPKAFGLRPSPLTLHKPNENDAPQSPSILENQSPKFFQADSKKLPPTPPARQLLEQTDQLCYPTLQPKVPIKIMVNPPEPPPRPNATNKSPLAPSEQPKSLLRAKMSSRGTGQRPVFGSPKVSRKKNPFLAKRRTVGVKELGTADYQGWLYRRLRIGDSGAQWIKGWFILKGTAFYGFKSREAQKADCFISLPGFTTSPADEVKSRKFAFKVYHTGTVFYFAAECEEELASWLDCLSMATFALDANVLKTSAAEGAVFSETEDEGEDDSEVADSCFPSPKMRKLTNFLSGHSSHPTSASAASGSPKPAHSHQNLASSGDSKIYDIQKRFGSLKKLGYRSKYANQLSSQSSSSATSLSSSDHSQDGPSAPHSLDRKVLRFLSSSKSQNVPVPTPQFKSYRRVVASENPPSVSRQTDASTLGRGEETLVDLSGSSQRNAINQMGDHELRRSHRGTGFRGEDMQVSLTLEQFMLQRQEEERLQNQRSHSPHHQDRGRDRDQDRDVLVSNHREQSEGYTEDPVQSRQKSLEKRRTPPPAPPVLSSPLPPPHMLPCGRPIPAARTKLPSPASSIMDPPSVVPRATKTSVDTHERREPSATVNQTIESSSVSILKKPVAPKPPCLKNAAMYQPPPVAFSPSPNFGPSFEMSLDHRGIAGSLTDEAWDNSRLKGTGSKIRQFLSPKRGHQIPQSQLSPINQLEVPIPSPQRTILGSPRLHRALFRQSDGQRQKNSLSRESGENSLCSPSNASVSTPSAMSSPIPSAEWASDITPSVSPKPTMGVAMIGKKPAPTPPSPLTAINTFSAISPPLSPPQTPLSPPPDYPGLEYPPVFEPGIYSLSDSSTFLSQSSSLYSPSSDSSSPHQSHRL